MLDISQIEAFDWDNGNLEKNRLKHGVDYRECEETFSNTPLVVFPDTVHSQAEQRFYALGKTNGGRMLYLVFTIRTDKIRVISARDMSKKEKTHYENNDKKT